MEQIAQNHRCFLFELADDIIIEIILHLDAVSTTQFLGVSKRIHELRVKPKVNARILPYRDFIEHQAWNPGLKLSIQHENLPQIQYFIDRSLSTSDETFQHTWKINWNDALVEAIRIGNRYLINFFIEKDITEWDRALYAAALAGHQDLVDLFIDKGAKTTDWDLPLEAAAKGGHKHLVQFFVEKGASNWVSGLSCAAESGNQELVNFFIQKGANNWNLGLQGAIIGKHNNMIQFFLGKPITKWNTHWAFAIQSGNLELVKFIHPKLAQIEDDDWNIFMCMAAEAGHKHIVDYCIENGAYNFTKALNKAAKGGHLELVKFFIQPEHRVDQSCHKAIQNSYSKCHFDITRELLKYSAEPDLNTELWRATSWGFTDLMDYYIQKGATDLNYALREACRVRDLHYAKFLVKRGANDWNGAMASAARGDLTTKNKIQMIEFFIQKGADDWNRAMKSAITKSDITIINYFIEKGANDWDRAMAAGAKQGEMEMIKFFMNKGAKDWNRGLRAAVALYSTDMQEVANFFIEKGADDFNGAMIEALDYENFEAAEWLVQLGANDYDRIMAHYYSEMSYLMIEKGANDWNYGMEIAAEDDDKEAIEFFIEKGANDWVAGLRGASRRLSEELVQFFLDKGAESQMQQFLSGNVPPSTAQFRTLLKKFRGFVDKEEEAWNEKLKWFNYEPAFMWSCAPLRDLTFVGCDTYKLFPSSRTGRYWVIVSEPNPPKLFDLYNSFSSSDESEFETCARELLTRKIGHRFASEFRLQEMIPLQFEDHNQLVQAEPHTTFWNENPGFYHACYFEVLASGIFFNLLVFFHSPEVTLQHILKPHNINPRAVYLGNSQTNLSALQNNMDPKMKQELQFLIDEHQKLVPIDQDNMEC